MTETPAMREMRDGLEQPRLEGARASASREPMMPRCRGASVPRPRCAASSGPPRLLPRRAALPQPLQLPRRRQLAGRGGGGRAPRPARARGDRPRRLLRRRRRRRPRGRRTTGPCSSAPSCPWVSPARRTVPGTRGQPPAPLWTRRRGLPPPRRGDDRRAPARCRKAVPSSDLEELGERGRGQGGADRPPKGAVQQALARGGEGAAAEALGSRTSSSGRPVPAQTRPTRHLAHWPVSTASTSSRPDHARHPAAAQARALGDGRRRAPGAAGELTAGSTCQARLTCAAAPRRSRRWRRTPMTSDAGPSAPPTSWPSTCARPPPRFPKRQIPEGHTADSWLRVLAERGFAERYAGVPHEHEVRERLGARAARHRRDAYRPVLAVCYALGITVVDAVFYRLPFERFISCAPTRNPTSTSTPTRPARGGPSSGSTTPTGDDERRPGGRAAAADGGALCRQGTRVLPRDRYAWSKQIDGWQSVVAGDAGDPAAHDVPPWRSPRSSWAPRHLGIHSRDGPHRAAIGEVCPIERGGMDRRTGGVDKDACESMGLVKLDLLGLGMLGALDHMMRLVADRLGERWISRRCPRRSRPSTTCSAGPTRSGCSRSRAGASTRHAAAVASA